MSGGSPTASVSIVDCVEIPGGKSVFERRMQAVAHMAAAYAGCSLELVYVVLGDDEMRAQNKAALNHDYPTDVLSFDMGHTHDIRHGEILVSADTAVREAASRAHSGADELCLYAVHGTLHFVGYDDHDPADRRRMRAAERRWLRRLGCNAIYGRR